MICRPLGRRALGVLEHQVPKTEEGGLLGDAILEPFLRQLRVPAKKEPLWFDIGQAHISSVGTIAGVAA
jgi:hypothetical protein